MVKSIGILITIIFLTGVSDCSDSDLIQRRQQEALLREATAQTGMPSIQNFRERKILKDILELRDQNGLVTFTYLFSEYSGKLIFLGESIGYGIPYSTQYTNPEKYEGSGLSLPQADPNGLFSAPSSEGTWILLRNPTTGNADAVYIETRIVVSPFKLQ